MILKEKYGCVASVCIERIVFWNKNMKTVVKIYKWTPNAIFLSIEISKLKADKNSEKCKKYDSTKGLSLIIMPKTAEKRWKKGIDKTEMLWYNNQALNER